MEFIYDNSLSKEDALEAYKDNWKPQLKAETVLLNEAFGRISACPIFASVTLPVVRSSQLDGIAVRSADFDNGVPDTSGWVRDVDYTQADTGDDFVDDFDAVVQIEHVHYENAVPIISDACLPVVAGKGVRPSGAIVKSGDIVVDANTILTPERVAACAVAGLAQVDVISRPVVGFIPTGTELVPWGSSPIRGQNIEANSLLIEGSVKQWGGKCNVYPPVHDNYEALEAALDRALNACDIVVINGGSSRGEEDFNSKLIETKADWFVHGVRMVPGRPIGMAVINNKAVINMPGPVVAASLCTNWLLKGLMSQYFGTNIGQSRTIVATLTEDISKPSDMARSVRVAVSESETGANKLVCAPLPRDFGTVQTIYETCGTFFAPIGTDKISAGTEVFVELAD